MYLCIFKEDSGKTNDHWRGIFSAVYNPVKTTFAWNTTKWRTVTNKCQILRDVNTLVSSLEWFTIIWRYLCVLRIDKNFWCITCYRNTMWYWITRATVGATWSRIMTFSPWDIYIWRWSDFEVYIKRIICDASNCNAIMWIMWETIIKSNDFKK